MLIPTAIVQAQSGGNVVLYDSTLGSDTANFDITGISSAYTHLLSIAMVRSTAAVASEDSRMRLNNDTGANYSEQSMNAYGSTNNAAESIAQTYLAWNRVVGDTAPSGEYTTVRTDYFFYNNTTSSKVLLGRSGMRFGSGSVGIHVSETTGVWFAAPAAVNRITFYPDTGNWKSGSRLILYGVP